MHYCWCYHVSGEKQTAIQKVRTLAEKGQVTNSAGFKIGSNVRDVISKLGPMQKFAYLDTVWEGYPHLKFHITNETINAIISSDPALSNISVEQVIQTLGEPDYKKSTDKYGERLGYEIPNYRIDFLVPTPHNPGTLGHPVVIVSHAY